MCGVCGTEMVSGAGTLMGPMLGVMEIGESLGILRPLGLTYWLRFGP